MSEKNNKYTPNLRFPEFSGEWEEKKLGEIGHTYTGLSGKSKEDFEKGNSKFITFMNVLNNVKIKSDIMGIVNIKDGERQNKVLNGDMLFNTSSETPEEVGFCSVYDLGEKNDVYLNSFCFGYRFKNQSEHYPLFLAYFFRSSYGRKLMHKMAQGVTRYNLSKENFNKTQVYFPLSLSEQQKIASCLSAMDELIAAQAEKVEALKEKKTGLMQQLFPQPGETTPRLRFPEFTGEWVEKNINDCFEFKQGVQCPVDLQALQKRDGYIRFIRIIDLTQSGEPPRYIADPGLAHHICKEDLFMVRYGSPGLVGYGYEGVIANNLFRLLPKFDMCTKFFKDILTALHKNIAALCGIGALPAINFSTLGLLRISLPPTIAEQEKIADCLSALDDQIAAETEKLTALKEHKKGLMQQLFPQPAK
jgi:type I restriction enzyme S subunit